MQIENSVLRCFRYVVRDSQERTLWGIEFHMVGADTRKEREPNRKLVRGTEVRKRRLVLTYILWIWIKNILINMDALIRRNKSKKDNLLLLENLSVAREIT